MTKNRKRGSAGTIADKLGSRLRRAAASAGALQREVDMIQNQVEQENISQRQAIDSIRELLRVVLDTNKAIEAAAYMLRESAEVEAGLADQLAQDATLGTNLAVFMQSDPNLVSQMLELADRTTLVSAYKMLSKPEQDKVRKAIVGDDKPI